MIILDMEEDPAKGFYVISMRRKEDLNNSEYFILLLEFGGDLLPIRLI